MNWFKMKIVFLVFLFPVLSYAENKVDLVIVKKSDNMLSLYHGDKVLSTFHVVFGGNPMGHKQQEGDERTPEGKYVLDYKKADSDFYKSIHISYPNNSDMKNASIRGIQPGGDIMIHGQPNYFGWASFITQLFNWTNGCIALSNDDMDIVWSSIDSGTPIIINP